MTLNQWFGCSQRRKLRLEQQPETRHHAMVRLLARIVGVGVRTAGMLVHEGLARPMRDRRAVARCAGLTGSPDESGAQRREQGLARAGNARVRRGIIQLAWRFLMFQKESALALWYRAHTADSRGRCSLLIALACAAGSACSHRRRDTGRDTPHHLLDLCRPSDGRRARRDWRRRGAQLQRRLPPCVYDERPRLPVGLAVGAADQGPRARDSARGLTRRERDLRFRGPGTEGSNPAPSTGESRANLTSSIRAPTEPRGPRCGVLIVWWLDRLGRSLAHLIELLGKRRGRVQ